jgi:hypothetical protein
MKRKTLLMISSAVSIIGLIAVFFLKPDVSPQSLQMSGTIKYVNQKEKVAFISFLPDNLTVVSFNELNLAPGYYLLTGHLQQYKGKVEFVVDSEELKVRENVAKYKVHNKRNQSKQDEFLEE